MPSFHRIRSETQVGRAPVPIPTRTSPPSSSTRSHARTCDSRQTTRASRDERYAVSGEGRREVSGAADTKQRQKQKLVDPLLAVLYVCHTCNQASFHSIQQSKRVANTKGAFLWIFIILGGENLPFPAILLHPFHHSTLHKTVSHLTCGQSTSNDYKQVKKETNDENSLKDSH
jgi:hypothetical protein